MTRTYRYLMTLPVTVCTVLLAALLQSFFDPPNLAMIYLLAVVFAAFVLGPGPTIVTCVLCVTLFNYTNVPPYFEFDTESYKYVFTMLVMSVTGVVISRMVERLRQQATDAQDREARLKVLHAFSMELADKPSQEAIIAGLRHHLEQAFQARVDLFYPEPGAALAASLPAGGGGDFQSVEGMLLAQSADRVMMATPLPVEGGPLILLLITSKPRWLGQPEQRQHLATTLQQAAQAIDRVNLRNQVQTADIRLQKESLRNSILSTISHDLRTPLAAIIGAASSLTEDGEQFALASQRQLRTVILEESVQLLGMVENLLGMARLQGGDIKVASEWEALEEIAGSAVGAIKRRASSHEIVVRVPDNLPLIRGDGVLLERVIINLLENALKYSPAETRITLSARAEDGLVVVAVTDEGAGIPAELAEKVFDPFYRLHASASGGGLGLTICKRIIEAHGGTIRVAPQAAGGARVEFTLPVSSQPLAPQPEKMAEHE